METELTNQQKMSAGLRELADFLDENPDFADNNNREIIFYNYVCKQERFLELAQQLGPFEKDINDTYYTLQRTFGPIKVQVYCDRDLICTKRMVTKTIEVEEWDCPEHLLSNNGEKAVA